MDESTQQNTTLAEQAAAAVQSVQHRADRLTQVGICKLGEPQLLGDDARTCGRKPTAIAKAPETARTRRRTCPHRHAGHTR